MNKYITLLILACIGTANATTINVVTSSPITGSIVRESGYNSEQGDYAAFTNTQNIALGTVATVSSTIAGFPIIHNAFNITDGNYGNGRSWIGDGLSAAITIDLASIQNFDTVLFGRDRLGLYSDRAPGQFSIAVSNDNSLFTQIVDSSILGFGGTIGLGETVEVAFNSVSAQYVKFIFTDLTVAIDEIEIMSYSTVPEPSTILLFGFGTFGLIAMRKTLKPPHKQV